MSPDHPQERDRKKRKRSKTHEESSDFKPHSKGGNDGEACNIDTECHSQTDKKKKKKHAKTEELADKSDSIHDTANDTTTTLVQSKASPDKNGKKRKGDDTSATPAVCDVEASAPKTRKKRKRQEAVEMGESIPDSSTTADGKARVDKKTTPAPPLSPKEALEYVAKHSISFTSPPGTQAIIPITSFSQLDIPGELRTALSKFEEPTPIQACTWALALKGQDVVGIAETGSGKTLAFGIPALARLVKSEDTSQKKKKSGSSISVLVVAPTRELALQTHDTLSDLGRPFGIASVAVFGGVQKGPQIQMLQNATKSKNEMTTRIIVGTPGRILDLMNEGVCDLSGVDYLVLDEADRMLDKGFENDIRKIISSTKPSPERQTMMFSATWPEAIRRLASSFFCKHIRITVGTDDLTANSRVEQSVQVIDDARQKDSRLLGALKSLSLKKKPGGSSESRVLVFALYKKEAARVEQMLGRQGYTVCALHGDMSQSARMEMLERFRSGQVNLMVATDVAARGLDIPNVGAVINYTFPLTVEDYVHRIGRTGRGGKSGKSITFFTGDAHERSLAGEFARVLREGGFEYEELKRFPMTIKKREHSVYGAFYRDDILVPKGPTKIVF
ncbi:P-loop containing nucleoside triphosphate hydrolase protein [Amanita muscaria]